MSLNVLHIAPSLGIGGTQKAMEIIVKNLDDRFDVAVCGLSDNGERGTHLSNVGVDVFVPDGRDGLAREMATRNVDILHLHGSAVNAIPIEAAHETDVPIIVKTDNFGWADEKQYRKHIDRYFFMSKMTLLRYFRIRNFSLDGAERSTYRLLYNPLEFDASHEGGGSLQSDLNLDPETPIVGKIGRPTSAKWSRITVDAFERILRELPQVVLLLVTPPEDIVRKITHRGLSENVRVLDQIPPGDVGKFYRAIDVLTHGSAMGETFGYVIAEAFANRTPVVVNSTPMRDNAQVEVLDSGRTGYIANSVRAYADATIELLQDDRTRERFGQNAREKASKAYDARSIVDRVEREYLDLASSKGLIPSTDVDIPQFSLRAFADEYEDRLDEYYGRPGSIYRIERRLWDVTTKYTPVKRELLYKGCRHLFTNLVE